MNDLVAALRRPQDHEHDWRDHFKEAARLIEFLELDINNREAKSKDEKRPTKEVV